MEYKGFTPEKLVEFENDIAAEFNAAKIKAPVHLYNDNEEQIIKVFKDQQIGEKDWVLNSWRSHYTCLLKGVPPDELKSAIMDGRSISLCFKEYKILCSAIVTGVLPIAVGIALKNKLENNESRVFCFMGDMTSETGAAHECIKYSRAHKLPIHFIIEDNGKSVCTVTRDTWQLNELTYENINDEYVTYYSYKLDKYPHAGAGTRVQF
jgi:TPP-dependent pyruvate/acetoin dehydrogenase alpha subunit